MHTQYTGWLCLCLGLFVFRVAAQFIQKFYALPFLPPFEAWYSGVLTYPWLLATQLLIISIMSWVVIGFSKKRFVAHHRLGIWLLALGGIYLGVMVFRFIAGFTFASDHPWFGSHIPALFHMVLAGFILLVGHFHVTNAKTKGTA